VIKALHRISAPGGLLEVVIGLDPARDLTEIKRLGLPQLSGAYLATSLAQKYEACGFSFRENGTVTRSKWGHLKSSWARRLQTNPQREVVYFIAEAQK
jgi:hypothetical protein